MKTFFASILGGIIALTLFVILMIMFIMGMIGLVASGGKESAVRPASMVLEIDLRTSMPDQPATSGPAAFFSEGSFTDVLLNLDAAATDPNVKGVFIRASEMGVGNSRAEELRQALIKLRSSGKFVLAHSQGMIGLGPSGFRAIAPADEIWLQPGSDVSIPGMTVETLFMKDLFDRFNVSAEIEQFYEYKNSPSVYKETDYTEPHREAMMALITDIWEDSLADIATDRGFSSVSELRSQLESGPLSPERALDIGLVNTLSWPEEAEEAAIERGGDGAELVSIFHYAPPALPHSAPKIAIVGGEGAIVTGAATPGPFGGDAIFASDRVSEALLEAGRDESIKAIVFRVDSGGGSAIASDQIWRAVQRVRTEMNKPVVVSMGSVAASGGYYVSAGADAIYALRTTITGSIGVYGGKYALADGLRQFGLNPSTLSVGGDFAEAFTLEKFTDTQRELLHASLERTYDRFMDVVATGREMDETRVREIARGRVWSGTDAKDIGLVSELGGLIDAIHKARELAGLPEDAKYRVVYEPEPVRGLEGLLEQFFGASAETSEAAARLNALMENEQIKVLIEQSEALDSRQIQMRSPALIER